MKEIVRIVVLIIDYYVFNVKFKLLRESVIPENADDEIWLKLYVFRNVQINVIGDAHHCDPSTIFIIKTSNYS